MDLKASNYPVPVAPIAVNLRGSVACKDSWDDSLHQATTEDELAAPQSRGQLFPPPVSIVVPFWGYLLGSLILKFVRPIKGTTMETTSKKHRRLPVRGGLPLQGPG